MPRRVSLPAADDLFRRTADGSVVRAVPEVPSSQRAGDRPSGRPSGRVKHDEKVTVYLTSAELLRLEHGRLGLRSEHGMAVDRGRLIREAIHLVLADLEEHGDDSALVRRLLEPGH